MIIRNNTFTPGRPVNDPNKFSGRHKEVKNLVTTLLQNKNKQSCHVIITGDRGIGKSSLLLQAEKLAKGNDTLLKVVSIRNGEKFNFSSIWIDCSADYSPFNIAESIINELKSSLEAILQNFSIELSVFDALKVSKNEKKPESISDVVRILVKELKKVSKKIESEKLHGLIIFIDEIDRVNPESGFGTFFKLLIERLSREDILNISIYLSGISGAIQHLAKDHPSVIRNFKDIGISKLQREEAYDILSKGFNDAEITCTEEILNDIYELSSGFPEIVHLIGSCVVDTDVDNILTKEDLKESIKKAVSEDKKNTLAANLKDAGLGNGQLILEAMAHYPEKHIPLEHVTGKLGLTSQRLGSTIQRLLKKNVIERVDKSMYTFVDPLLREYIKNFGVIKERQKLKLSKSNLDSKPASASRKKAKK